MPNRNIGEWIARSEKINGLTDFQFRVWVGLLAYVDDNGRGDARPSVIKGSVFPLRTRLTISDIERALSDLAAAGCVDLLYVDGLPCLQFPDWIDQGSAHTETDSARDGNAGLGMMRPCAARPGAKKSPSSSPDPSIIPLEDIYKENTYIASRNGSNDRNGRNTENDSSCNIINYLNRVADTKFRNSESNKRHIRARLADGYTEDDFKTVIDKQWSRWNGTEYQQYMRPDTLFRPSNFDSYLNAAIVVKKKPTNKALNYKQNDLSEHELDHIFVNLDMMED